VKRPPCNAKDRRAIIKRVFEQEADMGLLDVLNGMQNGPRGAPSSGGGGMSPLTMALLGLIAYKAIKSFGGNGQPSAGSGTPAAPSAGGGLGGGLGDLLQGGLGSLLGGGAAGGILSGGLNDLVKQFEQNGQGDVAKSWVGSGPNKAISPEDLGNALGADKVNALMAHSGMSRDDLLSGLSQQLPGLIDHLTPNGRLPTEQEAANLL
jgi:uncharacterized protein YidB (DUF937 family)